MTESWPKCKRCGDWDDVGHLEYHGLGQYMCLACRGQAHVQRIKAANRARVRARRMPASAVADFGTHRLTGRYGIVVNRCLADRMVEDRDVE